MIKWLHSIIFGLLFINAHAQDTLFLKRELRIEPYPFYHAIFIDTASTFKLPLINFDLNKYDSETYQSQLQDLQHVRCINLPILPRRWIMLYRYKGAYYLYHPSEWGAHYRFEITDSTTIDFTMDGSEPSALRSIERKGPGHWVIRRSNYWKGTTVDIQFNDAKKGIARFTFSPTRSNKNMVHVLMVDASKALQFPIIVNYCVTDKQEEFQFDPVE